MKRTPGQDGDTLRAALRGAIRRARRTHADKVCRSIQSADQLFKLTNWYKGKRKGPTPPIKWGNVMATDPQQKAQAFAETFFPKAASARVSKDPIGVPLITKRPFNVITHDEIQNALDDSSNTSAPGAFGSNYRLLKWAFKARPNPIANLYNACLRLGFHPVCLRNAVISVIPKPRRSNMALPKSYRPISLLETLSKCLEKVITRRLIFESGKHNLIPHSQFGGRDMTSCTDAGLCLVHDVRAFQAQGKHVSLLTLNVSGYFNNVDHARLIYTMDRLGFADEICSWIQSYLSNRTAQPRVDDVLCNPIALPPVGIPQGSPLSPILSSIYSIPLLKTIQDPQAHTFAYIDDFSILVYSDSHSHNIDILQELVHDAIDTLILLGLDFEIPKSDLIHFFSRSQKPSFSKLVIHHPDGEEFEIQPTHLVRWLGFYLDQKLSFHDHVIYMTNKANAVLAGLRLLANTVRGVTVKHARMLYKACVLPILAYGSVLWFFGSRRMSLAKLLDTAQNTGIRWLLGAFKTTPVPAMEHLASIPPIHIHLQKLHARAAAKLRSIPRQAELARRLPASWDTHDPRAPVHTRPTVAYLTSPIIKLANLSHPDSEYRTPYTKTPWIPDNPFPDRLTLAQPRQGASKATRVEIAKNANCLIAALAREGTLVGFTDGSKTVTDGVPKVGVGYSIIWKGTEVSKFSGGIGPRADIFDAEMLALAICTRRCVRFARTHNIRKIHIFSDNSAAVTIINNPGSHPAQYASEIFRKHAHEFLDSNPERKLTIQWIPGHTGIKGNDRADELANLGRDRPPVPLFDRTATWARTHATAEAAESWRKRWDAASKSHNVKVHIPRPPSLTLHPMFAKNPPIRHLSSRLVQLITGHGFYGEYQVRFKTGRDPTCDCGEEVESIAHLLYHCPLLEGFRPILLKVAPDLNPRTLFGSPKGLDAVLRFISCAHIGFVT